MSDQHQNVGSDQQLEAGIVSRRQFLKMAGIAGATVAVSGGLAGALAACGAARRPPRRRRPPPPPRRRAPRPPLRAARPPRRRAGGGTQVIKIGNLTDFAIPPLVNTRKALEAVVEGVNGDGGYKVGDTTYTLELISYDTKSDPNTARSAVERLISQDKVSVIFGDQTASNWATETEAAKVLALVGTPLTDVYKPEYKYTFVTSKLPDRSPGPPWLAADLPRHADLQVRPHLPGRPARTEPDERRRRHADRPRPEVRESSPSRPPPPTSAPWPPRLSPSTATA